MSENMTQLPPYDELVRRPELWPCVKAMVERLQAIVDRLPKTKDGVYVVPGEDTVWACGFFGATGRLVPCAEAREYEISLYDLGPENELEYVMSDQVGKCYSTRAAAEAAREAKC